MQHPAGKQQQGYIPDNPTPLQLGIRAALLVILVLPITLGAGKLFEAYLRHFYILQTIRLTITEPDLHTRSASQLKQDIVARLRLQGIHTLSPEQIDVVRHQTFTQLHVRYTDTVILFGNPVVALHFDETFP